MNRINQVILIFISTVGIWSCEPRINPNLNQEGTDQLISHRVNHTVSDAEMTFHDEIYVPIYSDIYLDIQNQKTLLAATLSIRNTSFKDSLFVTQIDYFNTEGDLVRRYIDQPIVIGPMGTINYTVEKEDDTGGPGANFIINVNARNKDVRPLVQAVMIGQVGNKAFSFLSDGYSIKKRTE